MLIVESQRVQMDAAFTDEIPSASTPGALLNQQETSPTAPSRVDIPEGSQDGLLTTVHNDIYDPEWRKQGLLDTEFNRKYPPDSWGEEGAPDARVWKIYRDEQRVADNAMLASWNKTLDVLLIFAGLFSAVSAAFIIESYKALQPDYGQYVATFLYAAAASRNRTGDIFPPLDTIKSPDIIQISSTQRWTNGLWFSSLAVSLAVALLSILVKQWLDEYDAHISLPSPSLQYWTRRHRLYRDGLHSWGVSGLISLLPLLLHLSLFLFFAGLILFLYPLDAAIAYAIATMVSCILVFYGLSLILPAWRIECPSYTPLLAQARRGLSLLFSALLYVASIPERLFQSSGRIVRLGNNPVVARLRGVARLLAARLKNILILREHPFAREMRAIDSGGLELDGMAISTLLLTTTDGDIFAAAFEAISGVSPERTAEIISVRVPYQWFYVDSAFVSRVMVDATSPGSAITAYARVLRAYLTLGLHSSWSNTIGVQIPVPDLRSQLGVDGLLLVAMAPQFWYPDYFNADDLLRSLQCLLAAGISVATLDSSRAHERCAHPSHLRALPHRSICLLFLAGLETIPSEVRAMPQFVSCFLLVFCAGRFHQGEEHEAALALRMAGAMLREHCSIGPQSYGGAGSADSYVAVNTINRLSVLLSDYERYSVDRETAQILAHHLGLHCGSVYRMFSPPSWTHLPGVSEFIRSSAFDHCVSSHEALRGYMSLINSVWRPGDFDEAQSAHLWTCIVTLLKMASLYALPHGSQTADETQRLADRFFIHGPLDERDHESALIAFLEGPNAVATWAYTPWQGPGTPDPFLWLSHNISFALRRRQRLGLPNESFVQGFFADSFLLARYRNVLLLDIARGKRQERHWNALDMAKHCAQLSPTSWADILAQIENLGEEGSPLRLRAVELVDEMRGAYMAGGDPSTECASDCPCFVAPHEHELVQPETRDRLWHFLGRFRNRPLTRQLTV